MVECVSIYRIVVIPRIGVASVDIVAYEIYLKIRYFTQWSRKKKVVESARRRDR